VGVKKLDVSYNSVTDKTVHMSEFNVPRAVVEMGVQAAARICLNGFRNLSAWRNVRRKCVGTTRDVGASVGTA